ncbi:MAG: DUF4838 domain-containing protein [Victivallales bacterium]|jgi:hypothetical protein
MVRLKTILLMFPMLFSGYWISAVANEITLVDDGRPLASIVLAEKPTRAAQLAAFEIQDHVRQISGAVLPLVREDAKADGIRIFVGASKTAGVPRDFKDQEYAVLFRPGAIVLAGNDKEDFGEVKYWHSGEPRIDGAYDYMTWPELFDEKGTLHAAYDFLEQYCGVRWFDQSEFGTDAPKSKTLKVTPKDLRRAPSFLYRDPGCLRTNMELYNRSTSQWTIRWSESTPKYQQWLDLTYEKGRKLPACSHPHRWLHYERSHVYAFLIRRKLGGEAFKTNHSFYGWYDRFWEKNPKNTDVFVEKKSDWFAQGYPDAKVPPQLCYSNPEVVQQCLADARKFFTMPEDERKKSSLGTDRFFPVVPMDNTSYCRCARCAKFGPAERVSQGYSTGDHSERVWSFVNQIAKGIKQSNPDKMLSALAYSSYAWRPKGMKIEDNIAVQMCLFPDAAANAPDLLENDDMILKQWADGRPLYLWLYTGLTTGHKTAVPVFPKPMGAIWGPLFQKYHKAGVRGMFFNGIPQETDAYFLFKFTEDPYQDSEKLIDDYFVRMYGPKAGATLKKFYKLLESIYANPRNYPVGAKGPELYYGILGTGPRMQKLEELVKQAEIELADAPEIWKKRFAMFKFGTWDYMKEGRAKYEESKVAKASASVNAACPAVLGTPPDSDLAKVDWRDAQGFCGLNGWLKDNGDVSLRKISGKFTHDTKYLYLNFTEIGLDKKPGTGDSWELLLTDTQSNAVHKLFIPPSGKIAGQITMTGGVPQEWGSHGAKATSEISGKAWNVSIALPTSQKFLDKQGCLFMNCRRNDAAGEDSPVMVATGNDFDSGKTGLLISLDKVLPGQFIVPDGNDLLMDWDFSGTGETVADRSGHGNDGVVTGAAKRIEGGIEFTGGDQYLEIAAIKGLNPDSYTFTCWLKYQDADRQGGLRIFTLDKFYGLISVPHRKLLILGVDADGKTYGAGPFGVELTPKKWHMFTLTNDGKNISIYENGRYRGAINAKKMKPAAADAVWRFGGGSKIPSYHTFLGILKQIQFYRQALSSEEIMAKYLAEYPKYRKE